VCGVFGHRQVLLPGAGESLFHLREERLDEVVLVLRSELLARRQGRFEFPANFIAHAETVTRRGGRREPAAPNRVV
jgi:hypothetical protein